jgi:staphyloferrin B biosynthesis citrate synthase
MVDQVTNPALTRMRSGDVALGMSVRLGRSGDIARVAKSTDHDFIFVDAQHSVFNPETIREIAQTALSIGIAPLVRVRGVDDPDVSVLLDNGVMGVVFPEVRNAEEARRAVRRTRFPPVGTRSAPGVMPHFNYQHLPLADTLSQLNRSTLVAVMVESAEGFANLEEIAAVDGVDVVHVGTNDLLLSLGKAGQFDDPVVMEMYQRVVAATRAHGKFAGAGGNRDIKRQLEAIRLGIQFVTTNSDIRFLMGAAAEWTGSIRQALAAETPTASTH